MINKLDSISIKQYSWEELNEMRIGKWVLFQELLCERDYSLPQDWLNRFSHWCRDNGSYITYDLIRSTTVWAYPDKALFGGMPVFACSDVQVAYYDFIGKDEDKTS